MNLRANSTFIVLSILLIFTCYSVHAEKLSSNNISNDTLKSYKMGDYMNNRLIFKIGLSKPLRFNAELNYTFLDILEVGFYTGVDRFVAKRDPDSIYVDDSGETKLVFDGYVPTFHPFTLLMGANLNIHLLPLFFSSKKLKFDFYICNKFYTGYAFLPKQFTYKSYFLPFHAETGLGLSYYFNKKWGVYLEGSYQYQSPYKADFISSYKTAKYLLNDRGVFHGRIGFMFKLNN